MIVKFKIFDYDMNLIKEIEMKWEFDFINENNNIDEIIFERFVNHIMDCREKLREKYKDSIIKIEYVY